MNQKIRLKLSWCHFLGTLAVALGTVASADVSAVATPVKDIHQLAQVGVRSHINPPTPLNLRPRVHISSPSDSSSHYHSHHYPIYHNRHNVGYDSSHRHRHRHRHRHYHDSYYHHRHRHRSRGRVIIISPNNHNGASNYGRDSFIRVIQNR